jgi:RNA polymerase sigma-70 factor (ECF subfamily)
VRACAEGRPEAFELIVNRHRRSVYQLCYRFMGNPEDAADLAQEVFLRAYRSIARFKGESSLATWLYRIGVNVCLNRLGRKTPKAEPLDERDPVQATTPDVVGKLLSDERAARVRAAIARLPDKQRATLILRIYQERSHQEIAEILGSSEGAVKANFFHALHNLKKLLGGEPL